MKRNTFIALLAIIIALVGLIVALAAYFKRKQCVLCDDFQDDMLSEDFDLNYDLSEFEADESQPVSETIEPDEVEE